ncbi:MAG: HRDC domain-containing protein, partial [Candidatus Cryptobacteroides sp.]
FGEQIAMAISLSAPALLVEIDNKETRKAFRDAGREFIKELRFRLDAYSQIGREGFDCRSYHKLKTDSILGDNVSFNKMAIGLREAAPDGAETYSGNLHPDAVEALIAWRKMKYRELNIPAYRVLSQKALLALADILPPGKEGFLRIKGLGKKKWEEFGEEILEILKDFRD